MVIPLHGVAGSTRRDPDTTAKSYNYCDATANRHGHAVVPDDIAFSRSAVTHRRSSAVMTATMNPRFVRPAPSALGPAHTPRIAGREAGDAHPSDTETPCRAQNTTREPHTTASRNRPPLRRTHDGAGGPSQGATSLKRPLQHAGRQPAGRLTKIDKDEKSQKATEDKRAKPDRTSNV